MIHSCLLRVIECCWMRRIIKLNRGIAAVSGVFSVPYSHMQDICLHFWGTIIACVVAAARTLLSCNILATCLRIFLFSYGMSVHCSCLHTHKIGTTCISLEHKGLKEQSYFSLWLLLIQGSCCELTLSTTFAEIVSSIINIGARSTPNLRNSSTP